MSGYVYVRRGDPSACGLHGRVTAAVITPPPKAVWKNHGNGYQGAARSVKTAVFHAGLITTGDGPWFTNPNIRTLSGDVAPPARNIFLTSVAANAIGRVDVYKWIDPSSNKTKTNITYVNGGVGYSWISLDPIIYSISPVVPGPNLLNGWVNYGPGHQLASYSLVDEGVYLCGLLKHSAYPMGKTLYTLPAGHRPAAREAFVTAGNGGAYARVDVLPDGQVQLIATTPTAGYLSLANIHFRPASAAFKAVPMVSYWVNYAGYAPASVNNGTDARIFLRGLIKSGRAVTIGTIPVGYRPAATRLFIVPCSSGVCRIDVLNTGVIKIMDRKYGVAGWPTWISLSGVAYDATPDLAS
jgi:hypothetical protein